jgi:hypothetical protein
VSSAVFTPARCSPWPKGPAKELLYAVVEMKRQNLRWASAGVVPRIASPMALTFGVDTDQDMIRGVIITCRPDSDSRGPSWLTFLGYSGQFVELRCGQPNCACHRDVTQRDGPYFEWTYKVKAKPST